MPSVGMRRSTRVFVPKSVVKDADTARVLRSGKRLLSESNKGKPGGANSEEWLRLLETSSDGADVPCCKSFGWDKIVPERDTDVTGSYVKTESQEQTNRISGAVESIVRYTRKRRRSSPGSNFVSTSQLNERVMEDRMHGIQYLRKRRKKAAGSSLTELLDRGGVLEEFTEQPTSRLICRALLSVIVECSLSSTLRFTRFLVSVLNFMRSSRVNLSGLSALMCSEPIAGVFSQHGIHFLPNLSHRILWNNNNLPSGTCQIFGSWQFIPLCSLEFSVAPLLFMSLQFRVLVRSLYLPDVLVVYLVGLSKKSCGANADVKCLSSISTDKGSSGFTATPYGSLFKRRRIDFAVEGVGLVERGVLSRNGVNTRNFQKKRSSIRSRRARNPLSMGLRSGVVVSNVNSLVRVKHTGDEGFRSSNGWRPFSTPGSNQKHRKLLQKSPGDIGKDLKSTLVGLKQNIDSLCCNADILVIESNIGYRIEGAKVGLECLASKEWFIVIKVQDLTRYMHKAQDLMRPSSLNRFTHAMIWTGENGWKLEFHDRRDWLIFKELYKECTEKNAQVASVRAIPVPGVHKVEYYEDIECVPFVRPDSYITTNHDEGQRALMRKTANYDMDSGDEEWLEKLNNDHPDGKCGAFKHFSAEKFEEMVDALEKAAYSCPDDVSDESKAISLFSDLGSSVIVAAVYQYWHKKRKQKRAPLLRVFQYPPQKKTQLVQDSVFRKKRSFKQQSIQSARAKQRSSLQAVEVEEEHVAIKRVEQANNTLKKSLELAVLKRKRAQTLMDNADLATYKAAMAFKIAEAAELSVFPDAYFSFILG